VQNLPVCAHTRAGKFFVFGEIFEKLLTALKILGNYFFQLVLALFLFYVFLDI
jgi:hypothetical protein